MNSKPLGKWMDGAEKVLAEAHPPPFSAAFFGAPLKSCGALRDPKSQTQNVSRATGQVHLDALNSEALVPEP